MKIVDLTRTFTSAMPAYPGDPHPELKQIANMEDDGYTDHEVKTGMHVGTHMDGPLHMIAGARKLSEIAVEKFFGNGVLIDARNKVLDEKILNDVQIGAGDLVLIYTGWSEKFGGDSYYQDYPEVQEGFAKKLIELKVSAVGMDTPSPDKPPFAVHKILLAQEILIIENLSSLEKLVGKKFSVIALPTKFDSDAAPVRVVAQIYE